MKKITLLLTLFALTLRTFAYGTLPIVANPLDTTNNPLPYLQGQGFSTDNNNGTTITNTTHYESIYINSNYLMSAADLNTLKTTNVLFVLDTTSSNLSFAMSQPFNPFNLVNSGTNQVVLTAPGAFYINGKTTYTNSSQYGLQTFYQDGFSNVFFMGFTPSNSTNGPGAITPWTSDINGAGHDLTNANNILATGTITATNVTATQSFTLNGQTITTWPSGTNGSATNVNFFDSANTHWTKLNGSNVVDLTGLLSNLVVQVPVSLNLKNGTNLPAIKTMTVSGGTVTFSQNSDGSSNAAVTVTGGSGTTYTNNSGNAGVIIGSGIGTNMPAVGGVVSGFPSNEVFSTSGTNAIDAEVTKGLATNVPPFALTASSATNGSSVTSLNGSVTISPSTNSYGATNYDLSVSTNTPPSAVFEGVIVANGQTNWGLDASAYKRFDVFLIPWGVTSGFTNPVNLYLTNLSALTISNANLDYFITLHNFTTNFVTVNLPQWQPWLSPDGSSLQPSSIAFQREEQLKLSIMSPQTPWPNQTVVTVNFTNGTQNGQTFHISVNGGNVNYLWTNNSTGFDVVADSSPSISKTNLLNKLTTGFSDRNQLYFQDTSATNFSIYAVRNTTLSAFQTGISGVNWASVTTANNASGTSGSPIYQSQVFSGLEPTASQFGLNVFGSFQASGSTIANFPSTAHVNYFSISNSTINALSFVSINGSGQWSSTEGLFDSLFSISGSGYFGVGSVANATNMVWSSYFLGVVGGGSPQFYLNGTTITTPLIPAMTSSNTPSGLATASSFFSGHDPYLAFPGNPAFNFWFNDSANLTFSNSYVQYQFPITHSITNSIQGNVEINSAATVVVTNIGSYSSDGITWFPAFTNTVSCTANTPITVGLTNAINVKGASYFRWGFTSTTTMEIVDGLIQLYGF